jgi:hypothetical protein
VSSTPADVFVGLGRRLLESSADELCSLRVAWALGLVGQGKITKIASGPDVIVSRWLDQRIFMIMDSGGFRHHRRKERVLRYYL